MWKGGALSEESEQPGGEKPEEPVGEKREESGREGSVVNVIQQNALIVNGRKVKREGKADESASGRWL